jgi:hypothetical protein
MADKVYWCGEVGPNDDFGMPLDMEFIDGRTKMGPWGIMTPESFSSYGLGRTGPGFGQRYQKQPDGRWLKVEG